MSRVSLVIDGRTAEVEDGDTILDAAHAAGVEIPTLCHRDDLKPFASCFLCVVEVEGRPDLVPSCSVPAASGMQVRTATDRVRNARKVCLELLLSDHRGSCVAPCMAECPCHVDIPGFLEHISRGEFDQAEALIKQTLPLPSALGRVCPRPCETACNRRLFDSSLAICELKRSAADPSRGTAGAYRPPLAPDTGKRVAVIGAGPAGLSAAYFLRMKGHACTVFEMHAQPGGMLRWGIPAFRLPRHVIDDEVRAITDMGAEIRYGVAVGRDVSLEDLRRQFDALFIGVGAQAAAAMRCPGEDLPSVYSALDFLHEVNAGTRTRIAGRVMVVGGGNTAVDAARTCVRLGAGHVSMLYRRTRAEMPAFKAEIDEAVEEGVDLQLLAAPERIERRGDSLAVHCIRMELGAPDASGRRRPVPLKGSEYVIEVDHVIAAIGQAVDAAALGAGVPALSKYGTFSIEPRTGATSLPGVFAGGDCVIGPDIAVRAAAAGRIAAASIDQFLRGVPVTGDTDVFFSSFASDADSLREIYGEVPKTVRAEMPRIGLEERRTTFDEIARGFSCSEAMGEASRCLGCGCRAASTCRLRQYSAEYGTEAGRFAGDMRGLERDASHPEIRYESGKCILCGICSRLCEEKFGVSALGFVKRGFPARIKPPLGKTLADVDFAHLREVTEACPTGALSLRRAARATYKVTPPVVVS